MARIISNLVATTDFMIQKRRALLAAFIVGSGAQPASAGCFDWLFCKTPTVVTTPVLPYSAGFAPQTTITPLGPPVPVGQPVWTAPAPYAANFGGINPASALQMPAYGAVPQPINNPSVLTGMPVNPALTQQSFANPWATSQAGAFVDPQTSFNAAAAFQSQTPAMIQPAPINALPQPAFTPPPATGGLFGKVFGNGYQTSYNEVPTTVYRPVQQIDPATGQMVIVQQPCTTSVQQVQRSPYTSLQPAPAPVPQQQPYYGEPSCGGEQAIYQSPNQYAPQGQYAPPTQYAPQAQYAPQTQLPPSAGYPAPITNGGAVGSGVAQTSGVAPYYGSQAYGTQGGYPPSSYSAPIPSTAPSTTSPSAAPLQGYPNGYQNGYDQPSDRSNVDQPSLGATSPGSFGKPPITAPPLANSSTGAPPSSTPSSTPSTNASSRYSDLPPIPAADDYNPPAWGGFNASQPSAPQTPQPKISAPSWNDRTANRVVEPRSSDTQARYASGTTPRTQQPVSQPAPLPPRDDNGWFAIGQ
jgi:hypothetical protein